MLTGTYTNPREKSSPLRGKLESRKFPGNSCLGRLRRPNGADQLEASDLLWMFIRTVKCPSNTDFQVASYLSIHMPVEMLPTTNKNKKLGGAQKTSAHVLLLVYSLAGISCLILFKPWVRVVGITF